MIIINDTIRAEAISGHAVYPYPLTSDENSLSLNSVLYAHSAEIWNTNNENGRYFK